MCVNFFYILILVNKFIKYNRNDSCYHIKYFDLYLFLNFLIFPPAFLTIDTDLLLLLLFTQYSADTRR